MMKDGNVEWFQLNSGAYTVLIVNQPGAVILTLVPLSGGHPIIVRFNAENWQIFQEYAANINPRKED